MQQIIQESEKTKEVIVQTAKFVMDLKEKRQSLENATEKMLNELKKLRENRSAVEENYEGLESRSEVVRDKINVIDENLKKGADKIKDEVKTFLKNFGLKVKINSFPHSENLVELKIQFTEQHDYRATFVYDPVTEDYDLTELHPEHPRFRELRTFLLETKDIQGFLFNYRRIMLKNASAN